MEKEIIVKSKWFKEELKMHMIKELLIILKDVG